MSETVNKERLDQEIKATKNKILELWNERENNDISLREHIRKLAYQLEETREYENNRISTEIIKMFSASKPLQVYISETLDQKYKRKYERLEIVSSSTLTNNIEECSIEAERLIEVLLKIKNVNPEDIGRREFQEVAQLVHDSKNRIERISDLYNIPLPYTIGRLPNDKEPPIGEDDAELSRDEKVLKFRAILIEEFKGLVDDLLKIQAGIEIKNYVSDEPKTLEEYILGVKSLRAIIKPVTDRKWGHDLLGWCDIIENYYEQGGTYAATKSAVDAADLINPRTGKVVQRKITKEQIDAVHPKLLKNMRFIVNNFKFALSMFKNFREKELGYRAKRRVELGPKLSESA